MGGGGFAVLFRDGKKYDIRWSMKSGEYEKKSGQPRPIKFVNADGSPRRSSQAVPGSLWQRLIRLYPMKAMASGI